ncbi:hypothetical protein SAMN05421770_10961 [Granulicella rosea]|uniref:Spondin_N n=1 Tax=Granulicella rosea TaxID=474952 RepID=A0A239M3V8_9BACT|nr:hypothetical protein [Granulicella rosea]SNT36803.1 hypothetical protein SAMN05421770_10961 [Granulicella rosea]
MLIAPLMTAAALALNLASAPADAALAPQTTLPIVFTRSVDAGRAHIGDAIAAKTTQAVRLANGHVLPAGSQVLGHVTAGAAFRYDSTPYAKQPQAELAFTFDAVVDHGQQIPLKVVVRAMADPLTASAASESFSSDDTLATTTQVGGDQVQGSQEEVLSRDGDVVAYRRGSGVYAHLIAAQGNAPRGCDASNTEQSVSLFSASACGLYGFTDVSMTDAGDGGAVVLASRRRSPKIWAHSHALLEVVAAQ